MKILSKEVTQASLLAMIKLERVVNSNLYL